MNKTIRQSLADWFTSVNHNTSEKGNIIANSHRGRILAIDIETAPLVAYCWGLWKQNISYKHIAKHGRTLCFSYRWLDDPNFETKGVWINGVEDIKFAHSLLNEADVVVTYNGTKFDIPVLYSEFLINRITPPSPYINIDLYQTVKKAFRFPSNKMDYVVTRLGYDGKIVHRGMDMWTECMDGNEAAIAEMLEYNIRDVDMLMHLFNSLLPWVTKRIVPMQVGHLCPKCGSDNLRLKGTARGYQRYRCNDCGGWSRENKMVPEMKGRDIIKLHPLNNI